MSIKINLNDTIFRLKNDEGFCERVYSNGIQIYIERLQQYGFQNFEKVLDAGCGFGQWSLSLAQINKDVYSCDADNTRIEFLKKTALENKVSNIYTRQAFIDSLPYEDEWFEAVFCYEVIFLTSWKKSLAELVRVLKRGGKLYVNANGLGWYKHLWYTAHNKTDDYNPQYIAANAWQNTYCYNNGLEVQFPCDLIIEPQELIPEAQHLGISDMVWDGEGLINTTGKTKSFFQKEYFGDVGVYEMIGIKK